MLICIQFSTKLYAQKELVISGGNVVSSYVCDNNKAFVWGSNKNTVGAGILGTGSTANYLATPTEIPYFSTNGITIQQINSGSGAHFVALDCNSNVWAWGDNTYGQIGNSTTANNVTTPARVKGGAVDAAHKDASGNLTNVKVVYAGANNSFAILDNGELVAWGLNTYDNNSGNNYTDGVGQLGDGTTTSRTTPVYVMTSAGVKLTGVKQVFAGDVCAYALVDPDGDGIGTVYSWGNGLSGTLGRNAAGTGNPSNGNTVQSSFALPVFYADNTPMNNIVSISSGDVFGIALDVDGYVWTWGNGGWNNATGNTTTNYTGSDPRKVLKGTTVLPSNDGTYLLAKAIGGGQGYGMAVSIDGKPVTWGGGGCGDGGATGNGTITGSSGVVQYVKYSAAGIHNDVILINRGDTWGFYGRSDGTMWTWGCNGEGQLGIGNITSQPYAVQITPPSGCDAKLPPPNVSLSPSSLTVCESAFLSSGGLQLNSGFVIAPALFSNYKIRWYKNGVQVAQADPVTSINDLKYTATTIGTYRVEVEIISATCSSYEIAHAQMTISAWPSTFSIPSGQTYCGNSADVHVTSTATTNSIYEWFPTSVSTTKMGISTGSNIITLDVSSIPAVAGTPNTKTVYVEEKSGASGMVMKKSDGCDPTWYADSKDMNNTYQSAFTITEAVTIDSLTVPVLLRAYDNNNPNVSGTINFGIYGSRFNNGGDVADESNIIGTFSVSVSGTRTAASSDIRKEVTIFVNKQLTTPGKYFIAPLKTGALTGFVGNGTILLGSGNCGQSVPIVDDVNGTIIKFEGVSTSFANPQTGGNVRQGHFYNVYFKTTQRYCDRKAVVLQENCPCITPTTVTIASSDADGYLCPGGTLTLATTPSQINTSSFDFEWFKGPITSTSITGATSMGAAIDNIDMTTKIVTSGNEGTYYVRIRDKSMPGTSACYKEASFKVYDATTPTYAISGAGSYCPESTTKSPIVITFSNGTPPYNFDEDVTGTGKTSTTSIYTINNPIAGTYKPTNITDGRGCAADPSTLNAPVQDLLTPVLNIAPITSFCNGTATTVNIATYVTGDAVPRTYATSKGTISTVGLLTLAGAGTYTVTVIATGTIAPGCQNTKTITFDVWAVPTVSITPPPSTMCRDGATYTIQVSPAVVAPATGVFSGDVTSATFNPTTANIGLNTINYTYTDANGCTDNDQVTITVVNVVTPIVTAPNPKAIVVKVDNTFSEPATIAATGTNTIQWMDASCSTLLATGTTYNPGLTAASLGALQEETFTYNVRQYDAASGCVSACVTAEIILTRCPFEMPTVTSVERCQFEALPDVSASTANTVDMWKWYQSNGTTPITNNSPTYTHSVSNSIAATTTFYVSYVATDIDGNQCESPKAPVTVKVNAKPATPNTTDAEMCEGTTVLPLRTDNAIDKWYSDAVATSYTGTQGLNFTPSGVTNADVTYYVRREISGCLSDIASATLQIISKPTFAITGDKSKCSVDPAEIVTTTNHVPAIQPDDFFTWTISPNTGAPVSEDSKDFNPNAYLTTAGTYTIEVIYNVVLSTQTCPSDELSMIYTVNPPAPMPQVSTDPICQGDEILPIQAVGSERIEWTSLSGLPSYIGQTYNFTDLGIQELAVGTYTFELVDESTFGCKSATKTVSLEIATGAITKIIGDSTICISTKGKMYTLEYVPTRASSYSWSVTGNNVNYPKTGQSPSLRYVDWNTSGIFTISVEETTWAGCKDSDTLTVYVAKKPVPDYSWYLPGASTFVNFLDSTIQEPIIGVIQSGPIEIPIEYTMYWNFDQSFDTSIIDQEIPYEHRNFPVEGIGFGYGEYFPTLTVVNEYGCEATHKERIFVEINTGLYVPNAFAPSNPAVGVRTFQPIGYNLETCEIWVFDTWGNIIWYSNEVENGLFVGKWDGTYKGELLKSDVYIWKIKAKFLDGKKWEGEENDKGHYKKHGSVFLIR